MTTLVLAAWIWLADGSLAWCDRVYTADDDHIICVTEWLGGSETHRGLGPADVEVIEFQIRRVVTGRKETA